MFKKIGLIFFVSSFLISCGGGGGSSSTSNSSTTSYTSAAQVGEILNFKITNDSSGTPISYSYTITKSSFGCDLSTASCHTGNGSLTKNNDGTYNMSQFPDSHLYILQNGLLFGAIQVPINGISTTVPIVGMQSPSTSIADFADVNGGYYNFVSLECSTPGGVNGTCKTNMGSAQILTDGTFVSCSTFNLADQTGGINSGNSTNCVYPTNESKGKLISNGDGTWNIQFTNDNGTTYYDAGTFIAFKDPSTGQRVAIFDIKDQVKGGYGEIVAASQLSLTTSSIVGKTWYANVYLPTDPNSKSGKVNINVVSDLNNPSTVVDFSGTFTDTLGTQSINGTGLINSVNISGRGAGNWDGFMTPSVNPSEIDLFAGSGFYAAVGGIQNFNNKEPTISTGWIN